VDGGGGQVVVAQEALQLIRTALGLHKHQRQALRVCVCGGACWGLLVYIHAWMNGWLDWVTTASLLTHAGSYPASSYLT
jgi:hypothetical protein